jgi:DMSO/TMAO reductase YedYZ molybdopterin-dependent catalytic subunit
MITQSRATPLQISRRALIATSAAASGLMLSGCEKIGNSASGTSILDMAERFTYHAQRGISGREALAPEFSASQMSPHFRTNGNTMPGSDSYAAHLADNFANWKLVVDGLVSTPLSLSLADLKSMPTRTQITSHNCVEGWTAIGKWHGVPLGMLLKRAGLRPQARFLVFHCADDFWGNAYYESIDLIDGFHPQTILAWGLNDAMLPVGNGAPLRLRVERQLGYKQAKYVMRVEAVDSLANLGKGKGGFWEDYIDYEWYAGI